MKVLRVKDWDQNFENNRTRDLKQMKWVPIPNKHDGDGYNTIIDMPDGCALFGAWTAILQVASRCDMRGTLLRGTGTQHTAASISRMTRMPIDIIQRAIEVCLSADVQWLEEIDIPDTSTNLAPSCDNPAPSCVEVTMERKGKEVLIRESIARENSSPDLETELPPGFPKTEEDAKAHAGIVGCSVDFAGETWNKAMSRGGTDAKGRLIRSWRHHLATEWSYQRNRESERAAQSRRNGQPQRTVAKHEEGW